MSPTGPREISLSHFWKWAYSDLLSNTQRGILAEYLVAHALGADNKPRVEWDAYDVVTSSGIRVEVKSAAYIQSWQQTAPSSIRFSIAPARGWHADTNTFSASSARSAQIYIFCLLHHRDIETVNPQDLSQWTFFVLPTRILNEKCPVQKSIALAQLLRLGAEGVAYDNLSMTVQDIAAKENLPGASLNLSPTI